jgi:hypothetical protein
MGDHGKWFDNFPDSFIRHTIKNHTWFDPGYLPSLLAHNVFVKSIQQQDAEDEESGRVLQFFGLIELKMKFTTYITMSQATETLSAASWVRGEW